MPSSTDSDVNHFYYRSVYTQLTCLAHFCQMIRFQPMAFLIGCPSIALKMNEIRNVGLGIRVGNVVKVRF